jgi:hypothetical protein
MVHVIKVKNIPLDINEEQITRILKFVKIDDIIQITFKNKKKSKSRGTTVETTVETKKSAYISCNKINQILLCGSYIFKYNLNEYEISYYNGKKEKSN